MYVGRLFRKSADLIGDIHFVTLFYCWHKVLATLKQMDFDAFAGIVEMDETYFLYSEKGQKAFKGVNRAYVAAHQNSEGLVTNKYVF